MKTNESQPYTNLISTSQLAQLIDDENLVIVDCRFDLAKPDWGFEDYQLRHIPGALFTHLNNDLAGPITTYTGRHPLPDQDEFVKKLNLWGINQKSQVVAYDTSGGAFAARLWWMLKYYGHEHAAVMNGGLSKWIHDGYPISTGVDLPKRSNVPFKPKIDPTRVVSTSDIERLRLNSSFLLIDARAPQRFRGEFEPIDLVAGHIPGAVNRFHGDNLSLEGSLKPVEILKIEFKALFQGVSPDNAIVYCGSGVTSCHHLLAMDIAGLKGARLYVGSWSEWIRDPAHPIATVE
jgi:thiosulfate/3-mercaptopyruvate sulfurtransferase